MTDKDAMTIREAKSTFRNTEGWKKLKNVIKWKQKKYDPITKKKLGKGACLYHRHITATLDDYKELTSLDDFVVVNNNMNNILHELYKYWKTDKDILKRIEEELNRWY